MPCSIDHTESGTIPEFLCRTCHPELIRQAPAPVESPAMPDISPYAERFERRKRRRLRAERKQLREQLALLQGRAGPSQIAAVERKLQDVERDLILAS